MKLLFPFVVSLLAALPVCSFAQADGKIFWTDAAYLSKIKVIENGKEKTLAWCGGVNTPQFALADLNNDHKMDLVIFEPYGMLSQRGVKTFINSKFGTPEFTYAPEYEYRFPFVSQFIKLIDYNCDNIPDLFHYGNNGIGICDGYYDAGNGLAFNNCRDLRYLYPGSTIPTNIGVSPSDIPAIIDVDKDGDLDILTFDQALGNKIEFYKNLKTEKGFPCDTFAVQLRDFCWGRLVQAGKREHLLHISCDNSLLNTQTKTTKPTDGSNALCLFDADGDGDYDAFDGNSQYSDLQFFLNNRNQKGNGVDSMISQDTTWQSSGTKALMRRYPLATWLDIDQDGDNDILVSPQAGGENYKCIMFYKNNGTSANPSFIYQNDSLLTDKMIDVGAESHPVVYDYNRDGKKDLLVGGRGFYQPNGTYKSAIYYFENTSSGSDISFTLKDRNFLGLDALGGEGAALAIGDIDNDGKDDLIAGRLDGTVTCFLNHAVQAGDQPDWQLYVNKMIDLSASDIDAGNYAAPVIYDIDKDGKKDIILGNEAGRLIFYRNMGGVAQVAFQLNNNKLGNVKVNPDLTYGYSSPFIGKMDNTGKEYIVIGTGAGWMYRYDGFQDGNTTATYKLVDTFYSEITIPGRTCAPAFTDLDGDGKYELFIGNDKGGLFAYRQVWNAGTDDVSANNPAVNIYPNPAKNILNISLQGAWTKGPVQVTITAITGQQIANYSITDGSSAIQIPLQHIPSGTYYCIVQSGNLRTAKPVVILR